MGRELAESYYKFGEKLFYDTSKSVNLENASSKEFFTEWGNSLKLHWIPNKYYYTNIETIKKFCTADYLSWLDRFVDPMKENVLQCLFTWSILKDINTYIKFNYKNPFKVMLSILIICCELLYCLCSVTIVCLANYISAFPCRLLYLAFQKYFSNTTKQPE